MVCFSFASAASAGTTPCLKPGWVQDPWNQGTVPGRRGLLFLCTCLHRCPKVMPSSTSFLSPIGLCRLETKYQLFLSLDDICMWVYLAWQKLFEFTNATERCQVEPVKELATLISLASLHEVVVSSQLRADLQHVSDILTSFVLPRKLSYLLNSSLFDSPELNVDQLSK